MSQRWTLEYAPAAARFLERLRDAKLLKRLHKALDGLQSEPHPPASIKLSGEDELHRIRIGDYRILYAVRDAQLLVLVVDIGERFTAEPQANRLSQSSQLGLPFTRSPLHPPRSVPQSPAWIPLRLPCS